MLDLSATSMQSIMKKI